MNHFGAQQATWSHMYPYSLCEYTVWTTLYIMHMEYILCEKMLGGVRFQRQFLVQS